MSSYDLIQGNPVRCFPHYTYVPYNDFQKIYPIYENGTCYQKYYQVPCKHYGYHYGATFLILDANPIEPELQWIVHVIENGIVKTSITNETVNYDSNQKILETHLEKHTLMIDETGEHKPKIRTINDIYGYARMYRRLRTLESICYEKRQIELHQRLANGQRLDEDFMNFSRKLFVPVKSLEHWLETMYLQPVTYQNPFGMWLDAWQHLDKNDTALCEEFRYDFHKTFPEITDDFIEEFHTWYQSDMDTRKHVRCILSEIA